MNRAAAAASVLSALALCGGADGSSEAALATTSPDQQLQAYEGRRSQCWQAQVAKLGGCRLEPGGASGLGGDERRRLAVAFANCQFEEDGLPVVECPDDVPVQKCTSALAAAQGIPAYSVYSQHMLHVDIICLHLAEELNRQEQRRSSAELLRAAQESKQSIDGLTDGVQGVAAHVQAVGNSVAAHSLQADAAFSAIAAEQRQLGEGIQSARRGIEDGFGAVGDTLARHSQQIGTLEASASAAVDAVGRAQEIADAVAKEQVALATQTKKHREELGGMFDALESVHAVHHSVKGSYGCFESALCYLTSGVVAFAVTTAQRSAAARLPLMILCCASFVAERLYASQVHLPEMREVGLGWVRTLSCFVGVAVLAGAMKRYRDPQGEILEYLAQLRDEMLQLRGAMQQVTMERAQRAPSLSRPNPDARHSSLPPVRWSGCVRA
eukprot:TRINITY_DN8847_c0_g1_i1.p1 TRINITY_DN8847_c0_g1~~TRINITY_DN8847_c0_g1_i1.p1  ORF type:complete len:440 (+),score=108.09 TRINITY_DN8847_c0_g1_i1:51-1370(+)